MQWVLREFCALRCNQLAGTVTAIKEGAVGAQLTLDIGGAHQGGLRHARGGLSRRAPPADVKGTDLEGAPFVEISRPEPAPDWLACRINEGCWEDAGGPHMLGEILALFVAWAREVGGAD